MANIAISNLHPAGSDLFSDPESYLMNLNEDELDIAGGFTSIIVRTAIKSSQNCVGFTVFAATAVVGWKSN